MFAARPDRAARSIRLAALVALIPAALRGLMQGVHPVSPFVSSYNGVGAPPT
jgi:hypothetical protein